MTKLYCWFRCCSATQYCEPSRISLRHFKFLRLSMSRSKNIGLQITNAFSCKFAKLNSELENIGLQANAFVERTLKGPHTISFLDFLRLARFKLMQILIFFLWRMKLLLSRTCPKKKTHNQQAVTFRSVWLVSSHSHNNERLFEPLLASFQGENIKQNRY